jgi:hypothetical protein
MTISVPDTRQTVLVANVDFLETDLLLTATSYAACALPQNAVVTGGQLIIDTAFDAETSAALDVGDSASGVRYEDGQDVRTAAGIWALTPTGFQVTNATRNILLEPTYNSVLGSAGVGRLIVEYIVEGRSIENFE